MIAGQHDQSQSVGLQGFEGRLRRCLDRVGHGDDPGGFTIDLREDNRLALVAQGSCQGLEVCAFSGKARIAERHADAVDGAAHALAGRRVEIRHG